jgi:ABC-2 type transport system ATP-binding protein
LEAIRTKDLCRRFGGTTAVDSLSLAVEEGELFGLVGPDGAGKTTVMRLLAGILDPSDGEAWVMGNSVRTAAGRIHEEIGYMSQRFGLYPDLSVMENLHFYADMYGISRRDRGPRVEELLSFANLAPFRNRLAGNLSGGMKQKLGLSCALVHTPKVLFLDEPTNGVDPVSRRDFWRILYGLLRKKVTIFVSTAYLDEAERFRRLAFLHRGRLIASGSPEEIKALYPGSLLELRCEEPRRAAAILREKITGAAVGLFGDRVHVGTRDPAAVARAMEKALSAAGIPFSPVQRIEPGLEDVFVSAIASAVKAGG